MWYKNKVEVPVEVIYEIVTESDGLGWGVAVAEVTMSKPHFHKHTEEEYLLLSGKLNVHVGGTTYFLEKPGDKVHIFPGAVHWAESPDLDNVGSIRVITIPAWTPEDHILV